MRWTHASLQLKYFVDDINTFAGVDTLPETGIAEPVTKGNVYWKRASYRVSLSEMPDSLLLFDAVIVFPDPEEEKSSHSLSA